MPRVSCFFVVVFSSGSRAEITVESPFNSHSWCCFHFLSCQILPTVEKKKKNPHSCNLSARLRSLHGHPGEKNTKYIWNLATHLLQDDTVSSVSRALPPVSVKGSVHISLLLSSVLTSPVQGGARLPQCRPKPLSVAASSEQPHKNTGSTSSWGGGW